MVLMPVEFAFFRLLFDFWTEFDLVLDRFISPSLFQSGVNSSTG